MIDRLPKNPFARVVIALTALVVVANLVLWLAGALRPAPGGPRSSAFSTQPLGFAAWAELAERSRIPVDALRAVPSDGSLPRAGTLVVLDARRVRTDEARALRRFVERGGRLIAGGRDPGEWLAELGGAGEDWSPRGPRRAATIVPIAATQATAAVRTAGEGSWDDAGNALPVLAGDDGDLLLSKRVGDGELLLLADSSPLQNRLIGEADNAALALGLAGGGPLVFAESLHGYGSQRGLTALPTNVKWALGLLLAGALLLIAARGRRFGPVEIDDRPDPPPRALYVDALAATLSRRSKGRQST